MRDEIIIIGAGGHAKVVIEILQQRGDKVAYCISGDKEQKECLGVPVLSGDVWLEKLRAEGFYQAFVAIGANQVRLKIAQTLNDLQYELVNAISPSAMISPSVRIGVGVAIMSGAIINAETVIGDLAIVNTGASIDHDCRIGQAAHIAPQCALAGRVIVGEGGFMGIGSCAIPGITIGSWSIIGAGAAVIGSVPDHIVAFGVPARPMRNC